MIATVCIAVAPYHEHLYPNAVESAYSQTVPVDVRIQKDPAARGAGWARNQLLERVRTPFTVFLDADDWLEPTFVSECLKAYRRGYYVYTDWYEDNIPQPAPACDEWITDLKTRAHLVTALVPTSVFRITKGFDETLPGIEDADLWLRLRTFGYCGRRVNKPLVHYGFGGLRSESFKTNEKRDYYRRIVDERYKRNIAMCACNEVAPRNGADNERQEGDVWAEVLYAPMSQIIEGRFYPRPFQAHMWVKREHALTRPDLWRVVNDPEATTPAVDEVLALAQAGLVAR
jgi:glycosyltransferase involved in cell wall biosynthesis